MQKLTGNIIPHTWYKIFHTSPKKPDLVAITILSEILFRYRTQKMHRARWQVSYKYFEQKFGFSKIQARNAFIRLEEKKIIKREIGIETIGHNKYGGILNIIFFDSALSNLEESFYVQQSNFFVTPELENSDSNKKANDNNNKSILSKEDVDIINSKSNLNQSLEEYENLLKKNTASISFLMLLLKRKTHKIYIKSISK